MCVTTNQPDTKSNLNPSRTTKQHAVVSIQLNIVTCPMYPCREIFVRDDVVAPFLRLSVDIVTLPFWCRESAYFKHDSFYCTMSVLGYQLCFLLNSGVESDATPMRERKPEKDFVNIRLNLHSATRTVFRANGSLTKKNPVIFTWKQIQSLKNQRTLNLSTQRGRAFSCYGPAVWICLPGCPRDWPLSRC